MISLIIKKDLKLFFSNRKAVLLTFLIPILLISLFAFAFGGIGTKSSKFKAIDLLYVNNDSGEVSNKIISKIDSLKEINLIESNIEDAESLLKKGKKVGFLLIENGFQKDLDNGTYSPIILKYDAAKQLESSILKSIVNGVIMENASKSIQKRKINEFLDKEFGSLGSNSKSTIAAKINNSTNSSIGKIAILKTVSIIKETSEKGNPGLIQAVAGTAIMMLLFSIAGVGSGLLDEKDSGTLFRLLYAPIKPTTILFGKMGATFIISLFQLSVMFIFAWLAFGLPIFKDILSLSLLTISIAFAVSSFGIFLVAVAKDRQQLQNLSTIIILLMSAIGGSMIPLFIMPSIMQKIAIVSLNYWGIQGYFDIFWRQLPFIEIVPKMLILLSIGLVMTLVSIPLFKKNVISFTN